MKVAGTQAIVSTTSPRSADRRIERPARFRDETEQAVQEQLPFP